MSANILRESHNHALGQGIMGSVAAYNASVEGAATAGLGGSLAARNFGHDFHQTGSNIISQGNAPCNMTATNSGGFLEPSRELQ